MKRKVSKLLAWLLVLCMVISMVPNVNAKAADNEIPTLDQLASMVDPYLEYMVSPVVGFHMSWAGIAKAPDLKSAVNNEYEGKYEIQQITNGYKVVNTADTDYSLEFVFDGDQLTKAVICQKGGFREEFSPNIKFKNIPKFSCTDQSHKYSDGDDGSQKSSHVYILSKNADKGSVVIFQYGQDDSSVWTFSGASSHSRYANAEAGKFYHLIGDDMVEECASANSHIVGGAPENKIPTLDELAGMVDPVLNIMISSFGGFAYQWSGIAGADDLKTAVEQNFNNHYVIEEVQNGYKVVNSDDSVYYYEFIFDGANLVKAYIGSYNGFREKFELDEDYSVIPRLKCTNPAHKYVAGVAGEDGAEGTPASHHVYIYEKNSSGSVVKVTYDEANGKNSWYLLGSSKDARLKDLEVGKIYFLSGNDGVEECTEANSDNPGQNQPGTDNPGQNQPGTDNPGQNQPGTDKPGQNDPGQNQPGTDNPGQNQPGQNDPGQNQPGTDKPGTDTPGQPGTDKPGADKPGTDTPDKPGTDKPGQDGGSVSDNDANNGNGNNNQNNRIVKGTDYDTLEVSEILKPNGKFKALTVSQNNGVLTVNAGTKLVMNNANWSVKGYYDGRVVSADQIVKWNATDDSKASKKALKKYTTVKFSKKTNSTKITTKKNKKVAGSVYAVKLVDEKGNTIILNIERDEINKAVKKTKLAKSVSANSVSENALAAMKDGSNAKTVNLSLVKLPETAKSRFNNNAITWKLGSGKKAVKLEVNKIVTVSTKKGTVAYVMLTEDANVKVLSGNVKGTVKLSATVDRKMFKTSVKIK